MKLHSSEIRNFRQIKSNLLIIKLFGKKINEDKLHFKNVIASKQRFEKTKSFYGSEELVCSLLSLHGWKKKEAVSTQAITRQGFASCWGG